MPIFVAAIFISAFLLFQVQPIIARYILPWYGGSPAVWTTCMLFFQFGLLGGYAYAHLLATLLRKQPRMQMWIHLGLVILACVFLPITPDESHRPVGGGSSEVWDIGKLLAMSVGLPYIIISASGPLLQHWFSGACPGRSPYRLYAVSNLGSLLGLVSYPFLFEPLLGLKQQTWWWSGGFLVYGVVAIACARKYCQAEPDLSKFEIRNSNFEFASGTENQEPKVALSRKLLWVIFSACGSAGMLAITNQMCQDVSVVPFLWVLPLALYLITFIICFDREAWYHRMIWIPLAVLGCGSLVVLLNQQIMENTENLNFFWRSLHEIRKWVSGNSLTSEIHLYWQIFIYLFAIFSICMVCHGEMVRLKPQIRHLTSFYLLISLGGALGGVFVSLIAPKLFNGYWELHLILLFVVALVGFLVSSQAFQRYKTPVWGGLGLVLTVQFLNIMGLGLYLHWDETQRGSVASLRSFHGVVNVYDSKDFVAMYHGRITHGRQYKDAGLRNEPSTYYGNSSGVGVLLDSLAQRRGTNRTPIKMGVIGLGSGSLAAHARPGDSIVFYEINPQVESLAKTHFSYLANCRGEATVKLGDARTSLEQELKAEKPCDLDVLFVDAFSGDSIPIHLLTAEAFDIYFKHIKEEGSLVVHITNLHLDLSDPVRQLASKFGREAMLVTDDPEAYYLYYSDWVIITKNKDLIAQLQSGGKISKWKLEEPKPIHWTDDYSNLLQVITIN